MTPYALADLERIKDELFLRAREARQAVGPVEAEREAAVGRTMISAVEDLKKERSRFANVFTTTSGSVYFTLPTGELWRFKRTRAGYEAKDILRRHAFTDEAAMKTIAHSVRQWNPFAGIIGLAIPKVPLGKGAIPIGFGRLGGGEVVFEETDASLVIRGTRYEGGELKGDFIHGFHFGHPVSELV